MRQTSVVSQILNTKQQTLVLFSAKIIIFHEQSPILIMECLRYCRKEMGLEHGINGSDGVMADGREELPVEQINSKKHGATECNVSQRSRS